MPMNDHQEKAHDFLTPLQLGVACPAGAEKIIHGLRGCVDEHWHNADFAVLKIDLHNAFNRVSRQAVLAACGLHFPELLPWSSWCNDCGPPLGLSINITKCELLSLSDLITFPDEMKRSNVLHFEILGAPIGDLVFCAKFVAQKQSEASKLLQQLEAVGSIDPRNTPPPLVKEAFALFDDRVQQCFSECTAVDASASTWQQAQLSLKRGGLGLWHYPSQSSLENGLDGKLLQIIPLVGCAESLHLHLAYRKLQGGQEGPERLQDK
eukprot:Em0001g2269a